MPRVFKHAARLVVVQLRVQQPRAPALVLGARVAPDRPARHAELRAAAGGDHGRGGAVREQLRPDLPEALAGAGEEVFATAALVRLQFGLVDVGGAADPPHAAQVDVAGAAQVRQLHTLDQSGVVLLRVVVVPLVASGMDEKYDVG